MTFARGCEHVYSSRAQAEIIFSKWRNIKQSEILEIWNDFWSLEMDI
jgi:hypothetical protein